MVQRNRDSLVVVFDGAVARHQVVHVTLEFTEPWTHSEHGSECRIGISSPPMSFHQHFHPPSKAAWSPDDWEIDTG